MRTPLRILAFTFATIVAVPSAESQAAARMTPATVTVNPVVRYRTTSVRGINIFYREAGPANAPVVVLMHGFPTSSHMYRELIPRLATRYRVIAPDLPAFGMSDQPSPDRFEYTFENLTRVADELLVQLGISKYSLYVMDYGAPVGLRLAAWHPERVEALIIQNANAYMDGIGQFWDPLKAYWADGTAKTRDPLRPFLELDALKWQWLHGVRDSSRVSPDTWLLAHVGLNRPGNKDIQLALFYDYRNVLPLYPTLHEYFRKSQPPTLVLWGKHDQIFLVAGAHAYKRDLPKAEVYELDTGHFALEEAGDAIGEKVVAFLNRTLKPTHQSAR